MPAPLSLSTDQVLALLELARQGSLHAAAEVLCISEQGLRGRLLTLEERLGTSLYHKRRGIRRGDPLTAAGRRLLPQAQAFLARAEELAAACGMASPAREVHVAASQYLTAYVLIGAVRRFHARHRDIRVRLSSRPERDIEETLRTDPDTAFGVAAPYEASPEIEYVHLFSMPWSLIAPPRHPLLATKRLALADLAETPLIGYERGSTGRQHVLDAFHRIGVSPTFEMEATNTDIIVRMVAAGLGVAIVPLMPGGAVTRGHRVGIRELGKEIRPIDSGILLRRGERLSPAARTFVEFVRSAFRDNEKRE